MLIFLHQKYEIELRNLFRIFEKNRKRSKAIPYDAGIIRFFREKTVSVHPYVTFFV